MDNELFQSAVLSVLRALLAHAAVMEKRYGDANASNLLTDHVRVLTEIMEEK